MTKWNRLLAALVAVVMLLTMPIMTGISRAAAEDAAPENGTLTVSKEVVNGDEDLEFNFDVALTFYNDPAHPWDSGTVTYINWMMYNSGVFTDEQRQAISQQFFNVVMNGSDPAAEIIVTTTFTLKHGESVEFDTLPGGTDYTITEAGTEGYVPSADGQTAAAGASLTVTGTIDGEKTLAFVNTISEDPTYESGTLTVSKEVVNGDTDLAFDFELTVTMYRSTDPWSVLTVSYLYSLISPGGIFAEDDIQPVIDQLNAYLNGTSERLDEISFSTTFTLKHGESVEIPLKGGATYTVTEAGTEGYVPSADGQTAAAGASLTVTGTIDGNKTLAFVNTYGDTPVYEDGTLTVTKTNVGGNADDKFTFILKIVLYTNRGTIDSGTITRLAAMKQSNGGMFDDNEIQAAIDMLWDYIMNTGSGESVESVNFSATFTLKGGESITTTSLFGGADYMLTEMGVEGYVPSANGQTAAAGASLTISGTINGNETVAFVNTYGETPVYESGTLTVSKKVVNGDEDLEFNFDVALTFYNNPAAPWGMSMVSYMNWMMQNSGVFTNEQMQAISQQFSNAAMNDGDPVSEIIVTTTFTLKHGESVEFDSLPGGTDYTITETGTAGYIPSANGQTGTAGGDLTVSGVIDGNQAVAFTNTYTDYPAFKTQALGLEGLIGVHFFVYLPEISGFEYEGVAFEIDNTDGPDTFVPFSSDMPTNANGYYRFTYYVRSIEMADTITATLKFKVDGEDRTIEKLYSVKQYFETFDDYTFLFTDLEQDMTRATADYGHYVQAFLETTRTWVIGVDYTEMDKYYTDYTADDIIAAQTGLADYVTAKTTGSNMEKITYTLVLDSGTELRVYFKPAADYTGTFTFTVNGETVTEDGEEISAKLLPDGRYLVAIKNIAAHELYRVFEVKAVGDDGVESSLTASALSYVNAMMTAYAGNEKAINAAVAIYRYAMAAKALRP